MLWDVHAPRGMPLSPKCANLGGMKKRRSWASKGGPWLSVSVDPLFLPSGELTQVVHVARDITELKRAEEALRRSEALPAESQATTKNGSFTYSPGGAVLDRSEGNPPNLGL